MMKKVCAVLVALIAIVGLSLGVANAQTISNGGFEQDLNNWSGGFGAANIYPPSGVTPDPNLIHGGAKSMYTVATTGTGDFWMARFQQFSVTPGQLLSMSGWVRPVINAAAETMRGGIGIFYFDSAGTQLLGLEKQAEVSNANNNNWTQLNVSDTVGADLGIARAQFTVWAWAASYDRGDAATSRVYFDDISGGVVPEPSSLILLGSGVLGMLGISRKKKA
ncbi:MAG: PEP-CTERM sorting domain-containing protein [Candidatus Omnitrophica bacterium]|nr:PEP-CTERM sorting domain-containing protein [Candidatus Omnitrophota bacterium]